MRSVFKDDVKITVAEVDYVIFLRFPGEFFEHNDRFYDSQFFSKSETLCTL